MYCRSSTRRVRPRIFINHIESIPIDMSNNDNTNNKPRVSHRDIRLLKYMIYMFLTFIIGWGPFYTLMIFGHSMEIYTFAYEFLCIWAEISLVCLIVNMFIYNTELRKYLLMKFFQGF